MKDMIKLGKKLFPICRSLTGNGNLRTLKIIKSKIPNLKIKKIRSGTKVYDWKIPSEWNINDAYIKDKFGKKIIDFKVNNLHLVNYSIPVKKKIITKSKLYKRLYCIKELPSAIPYVTSYYKKYWGFCLTYNQKKIIDKTYKNNDVFEVCINSTFKDNGVMHYGELILPGKNKDDKEEILISTYICHPSMANNELSGPLVTTALAKEFLNKKLKKTLRILFISETIGSIAYISKNLKKLKNNIIGGYVLTCIGDTRNYSYLETKYGNSPSDIAAKKAFKELNIKYKKYSFLERGSDERQYNAPGVDFKIGSIMRSKHGTYKEYHTSLDNFNLVKSEGLQGGYKVAKKAILHLMDYTKNNVERKINMQRLNPISQITCEPNLGKRGLYNLISNLKFGNVSRRPISKNILNFLQYADGTNNLREISKYIKLSIKKTTFTYHFLKKIKLVK